MLEYYKEIKYYVFKMVSDKDIAKDITQETYAKVVELSYYEKLKSNNLRAFLYKIAKNIVIDQSRKNKNTSLLPYEEERFSIPSYEQPDEIVVENNQYENLIQIVNTLPPRSKEAFILHTIDGYTRKEIADMMNISVSAVEKHIIRATKKLQEKLKQKQETN